MSSSGSGRKEVTARPWQLAIRNIWRTMCVSINGPVDPDLRPFDIETGMQWHLRWGTFLPNLGTLVLWVLELFAMYTTDGQTNRDGRRTDKSNACCPLRYGGGGITGSVAAGFGRQGMPRPPLMTRHVVQHLFPKLRKGRDAARRWIPNFLRRSIRSGYCSPDTPTFSEQCATVDEQLFNNICHNQNHVLYSLLPPPSTASQNYYLRPRAHSQQLPQITGHLTDSNFITRMLFTDIYWAFIRLHRRRCKNKCT